jgi:hypothetical protein
MPQRDALWDSSRSELRVSCGNEWLVVVETGGNNNNKRGKNDMKKKESISVRSKDRGQLPCDDI